MFGDWGGDRLGERSPVTEAYEQWCRVWERSAEERRVIYRLELRGSSKLTERSRAGGRGFQNEGDKTGY